MVNEDYPLCELYGLEDEYIYDSRAACEEAYSDEIDAENHCENVPLSPNGGIGRYETSAEDLGEKIYLKHDVVNYIVTKSYACTDYNGTEVCVESVSPEDGSEYRQSFINTYGSNICSKYSNSNGDYVVCNFPSYVILQVFDSRWNSVIDGGRACTINDEMSLCEST